MNYKHGLAHTKQHNIWNHMMNRCYNQKDKRYEQYGGRGIKVIKRWHIFINFWNDMKANYHDGASLDRINVNGNYCKKNCRWINFLEQNKNKTTTLYVTINKKKVRLKDLCEQFNISYYTVYFRLYKFGWKIEKAINTPSRNKNGRKIIN